MVWRPTRPGAYLLTNILVSKRPDILLIRLSHNTGCIILIHPIYAIIIIIFSFLSHSKKRDLQSLPKTLEELCAPNDAHNGCLIG